MRERILTLLWLAIAMPVFVFGQFGPITNAPPDCALNGPGSGEFNQLGLCAGVDQDITVTSSGSGINDFAPSGSSAGCLSSGERETSWFWFEVPPSTPAGEEVSFVINPDNANDDYDFALYGPDVSCGALGSPLRCSWSAQRGSTGLAAGSTDFSEGAGGDRFVAPISVSPGEIYILVVDNFSLSGNGFSMSASGTSGGINCCPLEVNVNPVNPLCAGESVSISGSFTIDDPDYSFFNAEWLGDIGYLDNPFSLNPTVTVPLGFSGTIDLTLSVSIVNNFNISDVCTIEEPLSIIVNPTPEPNIDPAGPFCSGSNSVQLTADLPTGTWGGAADPSGLFDPTAVTAGDHIVTFTATDNNGCVGTGSATITVFDSFTVGIAPDDPAFCEEDLTAELVGFAGGSTPPFAYDWITPSGTDFGQIIHPTESGMYTLIVTDAGGCSASEDVEVTIYDPPFVDMVMPDPLCSSASPFFLTVFPSAGEFSGPGANVDGQVDPSTLSEGSHEVVYTITDANGCENSTSVNIIINNGPTALAANNGSYCPGEIIELICNNTEPGLTYSWTGPGGYVSNLQNPTDATEAGEYFLTVSAGGCTSAPASTIVVIIDQPDAIAANTGPVCVNDFGELSGSTTSTAPMIEYEWTGPGGFSSSLQNPGMVFRPGTYTLIVTANGCESAPATTEFEVTDTPDAMATSSLLNCEGEPFQLFGSTTSTAATITYTWYDANGDFVSMEQNPEITSAGGTYRLVVTANGCESPLVDVNVDVTPTPVATIIDNSPLCNGGQIILDGNTTAIGTGISYLWTGPDGYISFDEDPTDATDEGEYTLQVTVNNCPADPVSTTISFATPPEPMISGDDQICSTGGSTTLTATTGFATYVWSPSGSGESITANQATTYSLTVTDALGCTGETSFNVSQYSDPEPIISGSTTFCSNNSTTLDAGDQWASYSWTGGGIGQTLEVSATSLITLTVTDINGCTGSSQVNVVEASALTPSITGTLSFCSGDSTELSVGSGFTSYVWSNGSNGPTINVDQAGPITVTVMDADGCSGEATVNLVINNQPTPVINGDLTFCENGNTTLSVADSYSTYAWSTLENSPTIEVSGTSTVGLTVTDANGCTGETSIAVTEFDNPVPMISGSASICANSSTTLDASDQWATYSWTGGSSGQTLSVSSEGLIGLTVTDANGCTGETDIYIDVSSSLSPVISGDTSICFGGQTILDAGNGFATYTWSNGDTTAQTTINNSGPIGLTVTDAGGCSGEALTNVVINTLPIPVIDGDLTFCENGNTTLSVADSYSTYAWSTLESSPTIEVSGTSTVGLTVTDANGCTGETSVAVTEFDNPVPQIAGSASFCIGSMTTLDVGNQWASVLWSDSSNSPSIEVTDQGTVSVIVTDANGCQGTAMIDVTVNTNLTPTITGNETICEGGTAMLNAGIGFDTYMWSTGDTTQEISVMTAGPIGLTVTDASGCDGDTSIDVVINSNPTPMIDGASSFCVGNSTQLTSSEVYDQYSWTTGDITNSILVDTGGIVGLTVIDINGCTGSTQLDVTVSTSLSPQISGEISFCEGESTVLSVEDGYTSYQWSNLLDSQMITVTVENTYIVTVTDADNCTGTAQVDVVVNPNPQPLIDGILTFCSGFDTQLESDQVWDEYLWSNGDTLNSTIVATQGNVSLTVLDANGCEGSTDVTINVNSSLTPMISGTAEICEGETSVLVLDNTYATYAWSNNTDSSALIVSETGSWTVTVTDANGCSGEASFSVDQFPQPIATVTPSATVCNTSAGGSVITLSNLLTAGDLTGEWTSPNVPGGVSPGTTTIDFDGVPAGVYNLTYTTNTAQGPCVDQAYSVSITVEDCACPTISIAAAAPLCNTNAVLDLDALLIIPQNGSWSVTSNPSGFNPAQLTASTFDATNADGGIYTVTFSLQGAPPIGCPVSSSIDIPVDLPVFAGVPLPDESICEGVDNQFDLNSQLTGQGAGGTWQEISSNYSIDNSFDPSFGNFITTNQEPGIYSFEYSIASGGACPDVAATVNININESPLASVSSVPEIDCEDTSVPINAIGSEVPPGFTINWTGPGVVLNGNENTLQPTVNMDGIYTLLISNALTGCEDSDQIEVFADADIPTIEAQVDGVIDCNNPTVLLESNTNTSDDLLYQWTGPGISIDNENEINPEVNVPGFYTVVVSNEDNNCVSTPFTIEVEDDLIPPVAVIQQPLDTIDCVTLSFDLMACQADPNLVYEWYYNGTLLSEDCDVAVVSEGLYSLNILSLLNGCADTASVQVTDNTAFPLADAGEPQTLDCANNFVILEGFDSQGGSGITYEWSGPNGGIISNTELTSVTAVLPGDYVLTVMDVATGCTNESTVSVSVEDNAPIADAGQEQELDCDFTPLLLDGSNSQAQGNIEYEWFDPNGNLIGQTEVIEANEVGTYLMVVADIATDCIDSAYVNLIENTNMPEAAVMDLQTPSCFNEDNGFISIVGIEGGTPPYIYSFNDEVYSANSFLTNIPAGQYTVDVEDANGCQWDTTMVISEPELVNLDLGLDLELGLGDSTVIQALLTVDPGSVESITWSPANIVDCLDPSCLNISIDSLFETMTLSAIVRDTNNCEATDRMLLEVIKDRPVYIPNAFSPNGDGENELLYIFADHSVTTVNSFIIADRWGEIVFKALNFQPNDPGYGWDGTLKGELLNPAVFVYYAEVEFIDGHVEQYKGDITIMR